MSRTPKTKLCHCGRGKLMTGEHSRYNARSTKTGTQVCTECLMDEIREQYTHNG